MADSFWTIVIGLFVLVMLVFSVAQVRSDPVRGPARLGILAVAVALACVIGWWSYLEVRDPSPRIGPISEEGAVFLLLMFVGFVHLVLGLLFLLDASVNRARIRRREDRVRDVDLGDHVQPTWIGAWRRTERPADDGDCPETGHTTLPEQVHVDDPMG